MKREKVKFTSSGYELVGIKDIPDKIPAPGVILFHGLSNAKEDCPLINETAEALVRNGFIAFRFDFYGSGESPGELKDKTISILEQNARDALDYCSSDARITSIGLWGRSLGGTIAILVGTDPRVKACVIASGVSLPTKVWGDPEFMKRITEMELKLEKEGKQLPGTGKYKGEHKLNEKFITELPSVETKVIKNLKKLSHILAFATTPDIKVKLIHATTIINLARPLKEIHIFEGVDHDYKGVEREAVELTINWFRKHL